MRHAKSDWNAESGSDHDRPLNRRGRSASRLMGNHLAGLKQVPQAVLVSSALRARSTVELAAAAGLWTCPIEIVPELYSATLAKIRDLIRSQDNSIGSLMLAGHEPTSSSLVSAFVGGGSHSFPTAAIARVDLALSSWTHVEFGTGQLKWLITPKTLQIETRSPTE